MEPSGDTGQVPAIDIDHARAALHAGRPEELVGLAECSWLEVKAAAAAAFTAAGLSLVNVAISYRLQVGLIRRLRRGSAFLLPHQPGARSLHVLCSGLACPRIPRAGHCACRRTC